MWLVAIEAIFTNRRVFPKEWTTLLSMALVAIVVHRIFTQQRFGGTAVRVMAIRTSDLAFAQRHVRRKVHLARVGLCDTGSRCPAQNAVFNWNFRDTCFMTVWQFVHIRPRVWCVLPFQ